MTRDSHRQRYVPPAEPPVGGLASEDIRLLKASVPDAQDDLRLLDEPQAPASSSCLGRLLLVSCR